MLPSLHFTNIYGELLCARHCADHWGNRDERNTLSTHPSSSLAFPLPPGAQLQNPARRGYTKNRTMWRKAWPGSLEVRTPGFRSTTHRLPDLRPSLASVSLQDEPSAPATLTGDEYIPLSQSSPLTPKCRPKANPACCPSEAVGRRCPPGTDWHCLADKLAQFHMEHGGLDLKAACLKGVEGAGGRQSQLPQALFMAFSGEEERAR